MSVAYYDKKKKCPVCLKEFWAARRTAVYCSPRCKQRSHRKKDPAQVLKDLNKALNSDVNHVAMYIDDPEHGFRARGTLKSLRITIDSLLYYYDNPDELPKGGIYG